jgi:hypothetical protein
VNARTKGKVGEREWRDVLKSKGYRARRGQQFSGGPESPDVVCESLPFHWEVKRVENLNIHQAYAQSRADSGKGQTPVVAHRRNKGEWMITLSADDFLALVRGAYPHAGGGPIVDVEADVVTVDTVPKCVMCANGFACDLHGKKARVP